MSKCNQNSTLRNMMGWGRKRKRNCPDRRNANGASTGRIRLASGSPGGHTHQLVETLPEPTVPEDCLLCGVCCFSSSDSYVRLTGADWGRLGEEAARWAHFIGNRAFLRMEAGHCAALELRCGVDGHARYFCRAYECRPDTCRNLERGSPQCLGELAAKGGRPAAAYCGRCGASGE